MSNQEAVDAIKDIKDARSAAKRLTEEALNRKSSDDISCVVVRFQWSHKNSLRRFLYANFSVYMMINVEMLNVQLSIGCYYAEGIQVCDLFPFTCFHPKQLGERVVWCSNARKDLVLDCEDKSNSYECKDSWSNSLILKKLLHLPFNFLNHPLLSSSSPQHPFWWRCVGKVVKVTTISWKWILCGQGIHVFTQSDDLNRSIEIRWLTILAIELCLK